MFRQLNMDYPNILKLAQHIEYELSLHKFDKILSGAKLEEGVETKTKQFVNLASIHPGGTKAPFILVHGDNANNLLADYFDKDRPFYGYFHQSADGEPMKYRTVEDIADHYLTELLTERLHGPYVLGGFSFGGLVAYEMAQKLIAKGEKIELLVLIDTSYPQDKGKNRKKITPFIILRKIFYGVPRRIYNLIFKKTVCALYLHYKRHIPVRLRSYYILNIYSKIYPRYFPKAIDCPILFFRAAQTEFLNSEKIWKKMTMKEIFIHEIPGDHLTIVRDKNNFKILAETLKYYLANMGN